MKCNQQVLQGTVEDVEFYMLKNVNQRQGIFKYSLLLLENNNLGAPILDWA
jgi:hypothetical protein